MACVEQIGTEPYAMPLLTSPFAELDLIRQPEQANDPLQAFDAADQYLLEHLASQAPAADCRVLVLNDSFGALAASLAGRLPVVSSGDSHLGRLALEKNRCATASPSTACPSFPPARPGKACSTGSGAGTQDPGPARGATDPPARPPGPGAEVIAGAMIKHLPRAAGDLMEKYIGPVQASLAQKKPGC